MVTILTNGVLRAERNCFHLKRRVIANSNMKLRHDLLQSVTHSSDDGAELAVKFVFHVVRVDRGGRP